jgi:hypothetical protein
MDRYARLRMLPCCRQMSAVAIISEGRSDLFHTLRGSGRGKVRAGASSQGNSDPTRRGRWDEHGGCLRHALRSVVPAPPGVVMLAPVEVPRKASRAQIERPHQCGGNSADLVVSQGEVCRILLPRTQVNRAWTFLRASPLHGVDQLLRLGQELIKPSNATLAKPITKLLIP